MTVRLVVDTCVHLPKVGRSRLDRVVWDTLPAWDNYLESSPIFEELEPNLRLRYNARYELTFNESTASEFTVNGREEVAVLYFDTAEDMMAFMLEWS